MTSPFPASMFATDLGQLDHSVVGLATPVHMTKNDHARRSEGTSLGCRDRASASLVAAAAMDTANGRSRQEASAATWTVRADMLERLEQRQQARESAPGAEVLR